MELRKHALAAYRQENEENPADPDTPFDTYWQVSGPLLDFLLQNPESVLGWLDDCVTGGVASTRRDTLKFFVDNMTRFVQTRNQFQEMGPARKGDLGDIYDLLFEGLRDSMRNHSNRDDLATRLEGLFAGHQDRLDEFVRELSAGASRDSVPVEPVCADYTPELQLRVLHAEPARLLDPILDLGSGQGGALVSYLQRHGKKALGIDRVASHNRFVVEADWLECPLGAECWGTVISHMGLSNHFLHHHYRKDGQPERYAKRYMEVLASLLPGGSFHYAPGLPFFEKLLPLEKYIVGRFPVPELASSPVERSLRARLGEEVLYACRITRR